MKLIALSALIATASAALGDDCFYDRDQCDADGLKCAVWTDGQFGETYSCEDCTEGNKFISDSYGDDVEYECPPVEEEEATTEETTTEEPAEEEQPAPTQEPAGGSTDGEEKASHIAMSAAVLLAASALMA